MGFKPGTTVTKAAAAAATDDSGANAPFAVTQNGVRAGSITVTITAGDTIAANNGFSLGTITCDQVTATDVIVCNAINCSDVNVALEATCIGIAAGSNFKVLVKANSGTAAEGGDTYVLNWTIL